MWRAKFKVKDIVDRLAEEDVKVSRTAIYMYNLLAKFRKTESIGDIKKRPRSRRLSEEHYRFIDELMAENTDLTLRQLYIQLEGRLPNCRSIHVYNKESSKISGMDCKAY